MCVCVCMHMCVRNILTTFMLTCVAYMLYIFWMFRRIVICGVAYFPGGSDGKASAYSVYTAGDPGSIPGSGRSPGEGNGNPLQYSCLENSMDGGTWCFLSTFLLCCCRRLQDPLVYSLPLPWNQPFL